MLQAGAHMVVLDCEKHLGLMFEAPVGLGKQNPRMVAVELAAPVVVTGVNRFLPFAGLFIFGIFDPDCHS